MNDFRMKIAAFALVMGLGGLGGYALSAQQAARVPAVGTPKTQVVRRTVHAKPKDVKAGAARAGGGGNPAPSTATSGSSDSFVSSPVSTGSSGSSSHQPSGGHSPINTGSSGSSGNGGGGSGGGGEDHEFEGGDD